MPQQNGGLMAWFHRRFYDSADPKTAHLQRQSGATRAFVLFCGGMWIGVCGWGMETLICLLETGRLCDRGFLTLPFCPIYAFGLLLFLLFVGIPQPSFRNFIKYFFILALSATALEGAAGPLLEAIGFVLWDYSYLPLSLRFVSLPVSLSWGVAGTLYLFYVAPWVERRALRVSPRLRKPLMFGAGALLLLDWLLTMVRVLWCGGYHALYDIPLF